MKNKSIIKFAVFLCAFAWHMIIHAQLTPQHDIQPTSLQDKNSVMADSVTESDDEAKNVLEEESMLQKTISLYSEKVLLLETSEGVYNSELTEELIGLGKAYSDLGNHQNALSIFTRALHIKRINEGLHNINQLPLLELIIDANTNLQNFEELNKNYSYLLWIYDRNYDLNDLRRAPVYTRAANWHIAAYDAEPSRETSQHLVIAANLYGQATNLLQVTDNKGDAELISSLYGIVDANYKLVEPYGYITDIDALLTRSPNLLPSNFAMDYAEGDYTLENEYLARNYYPALDIDHAVLARLIQNNNRTYSLLQNSYRSGRNALLRILEIHDKNSDSSSLSYVHTLTHLGDWHLRFRKRQTANSYYKNAYQILLKNHSKEIRETIFGWPYSLGHFEGKSNFGSETYKVFQPEDLSGDLTNKEVSEEERFIIAKFRVTKYGTVRNFKILSSYPEKNIRLRRMARDTIRTTPFRPRMEDGQPIATDNVKILYRF